MERKTRRCEVLGTLRWHVFVALHERIYSCLSGKRETSSCINSLCTLRRRQTVSLQAVESLEHMLLRLPRV